MKYYVTELECSRCAKKFNRDSLANLCECGSPILVKYDLQSLKINVTKKDFENRSPDMWRYREFLPVKNDGNVISLGEGFTPLLKADRLGHSLGLDNLYLKMKRLTRQALLKPGDYPVRFQWQKSWELPK